MKWYQESAQKDKLFADDRVEANGFARAHDLASPEKENTSNNQTGTHPTTMMFFRMNNIQFNNRE